MPKTTVVSGEAAGSNAKITASQATEFARDVTPNSHDQEIIARSLLAIPPTNTVRGVFFDGLSRVVADGQGPTAMQGLRTRAGINAKVNPFGAYPQLDFYKLMYLAARLLHPGQPMPVALRDTARLLFPIFKSSLLGRTMSALMGTRPGTILLLSAKAYSLSCEGNHHQAELVADGELCWRCDVEPVEWYVDIFTGIVEGAMPAGVQVKIVVEERGISGTLARYRFRITW
jgi:uncharacterized protein (TIGR02265 family)